MSGLNQPLMPLKPVQSVLCTFQRRSVTSRLYFGGNPMTFLVCPIFTQMINRGNCVNVCRPIHCAVQKRIWDLARAGVQFIRKGHRRGQSPRHARRSGGGGLGASPRKFEKLDTLRFNFPAFQGIAYCIIECAFMTWVASILLAILFL